MIRPNELRIGNYIQDETYTNIFIVQLNHFIPDEDNDLTSFRHSIGIPLTEEWLVKFGFEKGFSCWHYQKEESFPDIHINEGCFELICSGNFDDVKLCEIKYVHQLQNIFFALTSKEL